MMMSRDQTLAELKKDVRSLLLSTKLGLSVEQLRRDYVGMLGHGMPLKELGFRSVLDMVKEMPEVVSIRYLADGSFVLKAVSDESTHGIGQLVSRQRLTKPKTKRGYLSSSLMRYIRPMGPIMLSRWSRASPALPAQLRAQLRQLISQGPLRLSELESRFQQCFGHPLRFTDYGFYSLGDMLARVPDLSIVYSRTGSMVSFKQPDQPGPQSRPQSPRAGPVKPGAIRTTPTLSSSSEPNTGLLQPGYSSAPSQCGPSQSITQNSPVPLCKSLDPSGNGSERVPDNGPPPQPPGPEPHQPNQEDQLLEKFKLKLDAELRQKLRENGDPGSVSPELKDKLQKVVGDDSQGLSVHDLPAHYKRVFGEELPVLQTGFLSVTDLVAALTDIFHLEPAGGTQDPHWIVKNINRNTHTESAECGGEEGRQRGGLYRSIIPEHLTSSLTNQQLAERYPAVQVRSGSTVPPDVVRGQRDHGAGAYLAVQVRSGSTVPPDVVRGQRLRPPTQRNIRTLAAVLVEHVDSPASFHVRLTGSQEARSMEDMMMFEMRGFYRCSKVAARYRLPERYLRPGQVCCAACWNQLFYRVVVQRVVSPDQVEVYYVDFGMLNLVSADKLMFLKSCYSQLPAQAIPAMLTGVHPISGNWSAAATASFRELCGDGRLVGLLLGYLGDALHLYLCDTHTEDDRYVHTILLEQGHARPCHPFYTVGDRDRLKSLYLGERLVDLDDEEDCQYSVPEEEALPEFPPALVLVEAFHNPSETLNLCESRLERKPSGGGGGDLGPAPALLWKRFPKYEDSSLLTNTNSRKRCCFSQTPPPLGDGNHANTRSTPEEDSGPGVDPGPAVTPEACGAPVTSLAASLPPLLTSLSLHTPGLAKAGCYGLTATPPWSTRPAMHFPLFGGRGLAMYDKECD